MRVLGRTIAILFLSIGIAGQTTNAQAALQSGAWSAQQRIPDYGDEAKTPFLIADQDRNVYAFNTQESGDQVSAIFVRSWSLEHGWSPPVDILLSPLAGAPIIKGVFLDQESRVHLIFFGGDQLYGNIYYTSAPITQIDRPQAWSKPVPVGENAIDGGTALVGDGAGRLVILFSGKTSGVGLYATCSVDAGVAWSSPVLVTLTKENTLSPNGLQMMMDGQGTTHAVWSEVNEAGIDLAVYTVRMDTAERWSEPIELAKRDAGDYKAAWPSIIEYQGVLFVVYQDSNPATRWMRQSADGGITWTDPVRPWTHVGEYSQANLLIDSSDQLHIVLGFRSGECCHGMWHAVWQGDHWGALEPVVMGPKSATFDPSAPRSIISQGNVILTTWWTDTGGGPRNGAWFSYLVLDSPELPVEMPAPVEIPVTGLVTPTAQAATGSGDSPVSAGEVSAMSTGYGFKDYLLSAYPGIEIVAGLFPVLFLFAGLLWIRSRRDDQVVQRMKRFAIRRIKLPAIHFRRKKETPCKPSR